MGQISLERIVAEYRSEAWKYERLARLVGRFLSAEVKSKFHGATWPVLHEVQSRAKSANSLYKNLQAGRYEIDWKGSDDLDSSSLWGVVGDLAGVRLIFHFRSDLDAFVEEKAKGQLAGWFGQTSKVESNQAPVSADKRKRVKEVFGYSSYHFPVTVWPNTEFWQALTYEDQLLFPRRFECEVQMRSVLQHAWAESEHDLRYKRVRSSSREDRLWGIVSAILEGADYLISERKDAAVGAQGAEEGSQPVRAESWSYQGGEYAGLDALSIGDSVFGYQLLHDWRDGLLRVEASLDLFDVDDAMRFRFGLQDFKARMWQQLSRDEPAFVGAMDFDGTVARAAGWDNSSKVLRVQPALYSDQMVTNHKKALSQFIDGRRVHDLGLGEPGGGVLGSPLALEDSPLSNTIGVACVVRTTDGQWVAVERAATLAYEPNALGCSASGSLAWSEPRRWGVRNLQDWLMEAVARECLEELGYRPPPEMITYLGFCREIERAGKPQFFFFVDMQASSAGLIWRRLQTCWRMYGNHEHVTIHNLQTEDAMALTSRDVDTVRRGLRAIGPEARLPSEELRVNLALALEFDRKLAQTVAGISGAA